MKFAIKHEIKGRMRIHVAQYRMSCAQADTLLYFLQNDIQVSSAKVYERTGDAVICYAVSYPGVLDDGQVVPLHLEGHKDTGGTKDRSTGTRCDGDRSVYSAR